MINTIATTINSTPAAIPMYVFVPVLASPPLAPVLVWQFC